MKTLVLQLPDSIEIDGREASIILAMHLYEEGKLSLGQAAELTGYSKADFMELLSKYNISFFNYDEKEFENDLRNASHYHI